MITVQTAESALKNIYLETVVNDINTKTNPFLTMVGKNTRKVVGKDAIAPIRYNNEGAVAAGTEAGVLPSNADAKIAEIVTPLKNLFGSFQITDKALKAAQNSPGAFASLIGGEMQNLVATAQTNLNRMVYGNGNALIAVASSHNAGTRTFTVAQRYIGNFSVGVTFQVWNANNERIGPAILTVDGVNASAGTFSYAGTAISVGRNERFYIYPAKFENLEMNGVDSLFLHDKLYNLDKSSYPAIMPFLYNDTSATKKELDEAELLSFLDRFEDNAQSQPADILLCGPAVRKTLFENLKDNRSNIDVAEFAGGFKGFSFNGIPMYSDVRCKSGSLYALNSDSFAMHQLCDWTWLEGDDGSILRPVSGKPVYSATLVKYADLVCEKPFLQAKMTGYKG